MGRIVIFEVCWNQWRVGGGVNEAGSSSAGTLGFLGHVALCIGGVGVGCKGVVPGYVVDFWDGSLSDSPSDVMRIIDGKSSSRGYIEMYRLCTMYLFHAYNHKNTAI